MQITYLDSLPDGFSDWNIEELMSHLAGPTIITLPGKNPDPLFIATLLHGNEHSGFLSLQKLFREIDSNNLSRSLIIFIANPAAASQNIRHLDGELDYNRIWSGGESAECQLAQEVLNYLDQYSVFACVDIHNNTGNNPFYSCINRTDQEFLDLAYFFFNPVVYFTEPSEVLSMAMASRCPSITLEVGRSRDQEGVDLMFEKLKKLIELEQIPTIDKEKVKVYHTIARMFFSQSCTLNFDGDENSRDDFSIPTDIDDYNFKTFKPGDFFGFGDYHQGFWVEAHPGENQVEEFFSQSDGKIYIKKGFTPAMMTKNIKNIRSDCFGYIMEDYQI